MARFEAGHTRQLPCLTQGPFRYAQYAGAYLPRSTNDCGFSPFSDDIGTSRVAGARMTGEQLL